MSSKIQLTKVMDVLDRADAQSHAQPGERAALFAAVRAVGSHHDDQVLQLAVDACLADKEHDQPITSAALDNAFGWDRPTDEADRQRKDANIVAQSPRWLRIFERYEFSMYLAAIVMGTLVWVDWSQPLRLVVLFDVLAKASVMVVANLFPFVAIECLLDRLPWGKARHALKPACISTERGQAFVASSRKARDYLRGALASDLPMLLNGDVDCLNAYVKEVKVPANIHRARKDLSKLEPLLNRADVGKSVTSSQEA